MANMSFDDLYEQAVKEGGLGTSGPGDLLPEGKGYFGTVTGGKIYLGDGKKEWKLDVTVVGVDHGGKIVHPKMAILQTQPKVTAAFFITSAKFGMDRDFFHRTPKPSDQEILDRIIGKDIQFSVVHKNSGDKSYQNIYIDDVASLDAGTVISLDAGAVISGSVSADFFR